MRLHIAILLLCLLPGCMTTTPADDLTFHCDDVAVVGRVKTINEAAIDGSSSLSGWHSAYQLEVHIKRVIRGSERRRIVPAKAIAHAQIREDRDFLIILTPDNAGGYSIAAASLRRYRPRIRDGCS